MEIHLSVSKKENIKILDKLTEDPVFIVSLLKNMGLEKCPDMISIKIGLFNNKKNKK